MSSNVQGWAHILLPKAYKKNESPSNKDTLIRDDDLKKGGKFAEIDDDGTSTCAPSTMSMSTADFSTSTADFRNDGDLSTSTADFSKTQNLGSMSSWLEPIGEGKVFHGELPSEGSALHGNGCRPCAWFYKAQGCANAKECRHCHLCPEGEIKNRKKMKVASLQKVGATKEATTVTESMPAPAGEVGADGSNARSSKLEEDDDDVCLKPPPGLVLPEGAVPERSAAPIAADGELPSVGSSLHGTGTCRPCAWFYRPQSCSNGKECRHCHLCPEGEIKQRKKVKVAHLKQEAKEAKEAEDAEQSDEEEPNFAYPMFPNFDGSPLDMSMAMSPYGMPFPPAMPFFALPSVGSGLHGTGMCRPCAWYWKPKGCANGAECFHCHMCPEGEIKQRKKMKGAVLRAHEKTGTESGTTQHGAGTTDLLRETSPQRVEPRAADDEEDTDDPDDTAVEEDETPTNDDTSTGKSPVNAMPMSVPLPTSLEMASTGSALHALGKCRPCAWHWKPQGCQNGRACAHCHICPEGELRTRRKAKVNALRTGAPVPGTRTAAPVSLDAAPGSTKAPRVVNIANMLES